MAFKKQAKKAQAAIEFLMTYGWMLLVVLIVGALIFSFVDFGNLLPSSVDFSSSSIQGDPQASSAYGPSFGSDASQVYIAFTYTGANRATVNTSIVSLTDTISGDSCTTVSVFNDDTSGNTGSTTDLPFINGQRGTVQFNCSTVNGGTGLIEGDSFEGDIVLEYVDSKRSTRTIPNKGSARLPIQ